MSYYELWAAEAEVWAFGAKKYSRNQWKKLWGANTVDLVKASAMRHLALMIDGVERDSESGALHAGHLLCNMTMLIEYSRNMSWCTIECALAGAVATQEGERAERKNAGKPDFSFLTSEAIRADVEPIQMLSFDASRLDLTDAIIELASIDNSSLPATVYQTAQFVRHVVKLYMEQKTCASK